MDSMIPRKMIKKIKALSALVGQLSLCVGWENGSERELKTVSFNPYPPAV